MPYNLWLEGLNNEEFKDHNSKQQHYERQLTYIAMKSKSRDGIGKGCYTLSSPLFHKFKATWWKWNIYVDARCIHVLKAAGKFLGGKKEKGQDIEIVLMENINSTLGGCFSSTFTILWAGSQQGHCHWSMVIGFAQLSIFTEFPSHWPPEAPAHLNLPVQWNMSQLPEYAE